MAQTSIQACAGFRGRETLCTSCGHPYGKHTDISLNSAGYCRDCVRAWRSDQAKLARQIVLY